MLAPPQMKFLENAEFNILCVGLTNKYRDITGCALPVLFVGRVMLVTNRPECVFLCALSKAGTELAPVTLMFYFNVRVLDQIVVPSRMVGCTAR